MTEEELTKKEAELKRLEVLLETHQRDLDIYRSRIERVYKLTFPEVEVKLRI